MDRKTITPFFGFAALWLLVGSALCIWTGAGVRGIGWFFVVWALCLVDLLALARIVSVLLMTAAGAEIAAEKKAALWVQTSVWGLLKLVCLGSLGALVFIGRSFPSVSLLAGLGTLIIVPLAGGFCWSQKVLNHA